MKSPLVSAVVMARNKEKYISHCIDSLKSCSYSNLEIVVVDNVSTDTTRVKATKEKVKVISINKASIPLTYNAGFERSKGKYVFIVSADSKVSKDFLRSAIDLMESDERVGIVCGKRKQANTGTIIGKLYHARFSRTNKIGLVNVAVGNQLIQKEAYTKLVGTLHEELTASEENFVSKKFIDGGYKIVRIPQISMEHLEEDGSLTSYLKKHIWYAKGKAALIKSTSYFDADVLLSLLLVGLLVSSFVSVKFSVLVIVLLACTVFAKIATTASLSVLDSFAVAAIETIASFIRFFCVLYFIVRWQR